MLAIILALGSSLAWGTADFAGGLKSRSIALPWVLLISQSTSLALLVVTVTLSGVRPPDGGHMLHAGVAGLSEAAGIAALYRGFAVGTISIVAPVAALAPVVPLAVSVTLGEIPTPIQGIGLVLAVAGIVLASRQRRTGGAIAGRYASIVYGLLAAIGFGAFFTAMDSASEGNVPWALFIARFAAVAAVALVTLLARARPAIRWTEVPSVAGIGVLIVAGDAMYATASTVGLLGVVAVLAALHTVVTIAWAWIHLHERLDRFQQLGIATSLIGVLAITAFGEPGEVVQVSDQRIEVRPVARRDGVAEPLVRRLVCDGALDVATPEMDWRRIFSRESGDPRCETMNSSSNGGSSRSRRDSDAHVPSLETRNDPPFLSMLLCHAAPEAEHACRHAVLGGHRCLLPGAAIRLERGGGRSAPETRDTTSRSIRVAGSWRAPPGRGRVRVAARAGCAVSLQPPGRWR